MNSLFTEAASSSENMAPDAQTPLWNKGNESVETQTLLKWNPYNDFFVRNARHTHAGQMVVQRLIQARKRISKNQTVEST